jgi:hydrogenase maturation protein HypF
VIAGRPVLLRRSRGYVPRPIGLSHAVARPVLAVGAQLKNACCIATGDSAYLGPHVGDLDNLAAFEFFERAIAWLAQVLEVRPEVIAHDLHPGYPSTRYALDRVAGAGASSTGARPRAIAVQHHHAHVASAMAEHGLAGPVIGVAYDGTGWGDDGTAWGGEILLAGYDRFERLATFRPVALAGGDLAIREPWRVTVALLDDAFGSDAPLARLPALAEIPARSVVVVRGMIRASINAPLARGIGRLFDAIAVLGLGRTHARYEGELAVAWNVAAADGDHGYYPFEIGHDPVAAHGALPAIDPRPMVRAIVDDVAAGIPAAIVSARFHDTLVAATADRVRAAVATHGRLPIVLTGGAFQNPRLAQGLVSALSGLDVHLHADVPPGDGGIALGQAVVADAIARR